MRLSFLTSFLVATITLSDARAVPDSHALHEKRESHPTRWIKRGRADGIVPMRIGLAQSNLDRAHEKLMDVAHPASVNYGKHWTSEEVIDAFKPSEETVTAVRQWLVDSGISAKSITHTKNKAWLAFDITIKQAESLLHTDYHEFEDRKTGGIMPSCDEYHIPQRLRDHIDYITPGVKLVAPSDQDIENHKHSLSKRQSRYGGQGGSWDGSHHGPKHHHHYRPMPYNAQANLSTCDVAITPACIAALYHIPPAHLADPKNSMGIFEAELQFWDQLDLNLFFANMSSHIPNGTHPFNKEIDGGVAKTTNVSEAGGESMLDLELSYPIVYPQTITVFNVDDLHYQTWANDTYTWGFNTLLDAIDGSYCSYSAFGETGNLAGTDPTYPDPGPLGYNGTLQCGVFKSTNVISLSYGGQEADVPIAYQKRQCNEYLKLGLQGISFIFASGDAGVGNYPTAEGGTDGPTGCLGPKGDIFNPTWPNSCPWITNAGATKVYAGHSVFGAEPESAVYDPAGYPYSVNFSSGGGFSNIHPVPDYQKKAVATYFSEHDPGYPYYSQLAVDAPNPVMPNVTLLSGNTGGIYNRLGRGIPDVSAVGDNIAVWVAGEYGLSGGTSASTPIFASIINRINEERLAVGKSTLGFLNPTLYEHPEMFRDITNGSNPGCGTIGFSAVPGWDPLTGLGTPNYPKMLKVFMSLP